MGVILVVVIAVLAITGLLGLAVYLISAVLAERRSRRAALQRAVVIQCAEQRMRTATQQAFGAMLGVVDQRFDRRR